VEAFFSGCISKVINDGKDFSWTKIKKVINDKNDRNLSTKIYRVIERTLNIVTDKKFKDTDKLYDAIEKVFIEFKNNGDSIESVKCGVGLLCSDVSNQICENFLDKFYSGVCQDEDLHKVIGLILQEKGIQINQEEFKQLNKTVEYGFDQLNRKIDNLADTTIENSLINDENEIGNKTKFQNDKKQDYIKNWNSRLFLHQDNDENPITLADAFIMPDFKIHREIRPMRFAKDDTLDNIIDKFVKYDKTTIMLITGVPGIGKSSITSWIANSYKENDDIIILRFRDFKKKELEKGILNSICSTLVCESDDLEDKIIVLDGFDEIKILSMRDRLLNSFFNDIKDFENCKFLITSRPTYVDMKYFQNVLELQVFDIKKVESFYERIKRKKLNSKEKIQSNLEVIGIPVILYMAIMSDVDISENPTKPELYDHIFAEKGGIFDRFYDGDVEYDKGKQILRNPENIKKYLNFLSNVAFKMFEDNILLIKKQECQIPELEFEDKKISVLEFPIKYLFEDTETNIEFIHKSIYEFFVSYYIFDVLDKIVESNLSNENLAGILGELFVNNYLSPEILEFLSYKIANGKLKNKFDVINQTFQIMIQDGMTHHTHKCYKRVIDCEMKVFANMLELLHLWNVYSIKVDSQIIDYLGYNKNAMFNFSYVDLAEATLNNLDLRNINLNNSNLRNSSLEGTDLRITKLINANLHSTNLKKTDLRNTDFKNADLRNANMRYANLRNANLVCADLRMADLLYAILVNANLKNADLSKADLRYTNLSRAILKNTCLVGALLDERQVELLKEIYNLQGVRVFLFKTNLIISYEEYCKRQH